MNKELILCMFYRPHEPIFFPKGLGNRKYLFNVPADFLLPEWRDKATKLLNKFNDCDCDDTIDLWPHVNRSIYTQNFDAVLTVKRQESFSNFNAKHQTAVNSLINVFLSCKTFEQLMVHAAYLHDRVNVGLYVHALAFMIIHHEDLQGVFVPPQWQTMPHQFFDTSILKSVENRAAIFDNPSDREPVEIPFDMTGNDGDLEHRIAYWREDIGINLFHWHWHIVYPTGGPTNIVNKDRRGELFYYLHHQILARYNTERLCNNLTMTKRFSEWGKPIPEAYFPKLTAPLASQTYASRPANLTLQDINRPDEGLSLDVADMERWRDRLYSAIHSKSVTNTRGQKIELDVETGINTIVNLTEPNVLSVNPTFYGSLHAAGHLLLAFIHDPQGLHMEPMGVMAIVSASMRDPIFYRWHGFLDSLFLQLKDSYAPYTDAELIFDGIQVTKVSVCSTDNKGVCQEENNLHTFWQKTDVDLSRGLDFAAPGSTYARITHINHDDFMYNIEVENSTKNVKTGTVRLYMAPTINCDGKKFQFKDQKNLMIELDKFTTTLKPGKNSISRKSSDSSVTIPFEQTFRDLNDGRPSASDPEALDKFNFCGCGWPQHALVPKGSGVGYPMELFVMVSDYEKDKVEQAGPTGCKTGVSYCGLKNLKYPDKRAMGYPFDRIVSDKIHMLSDFLKPNMKTVSIKITHSGTVRQSNSTSTTSTTTTTTSDNRLN